MKLNSFLLCSCDSCIQNDKSKLIDSKSIEGIEAKTEIIHHITIGKHNE